MILFFLQKFMIRVLAAVIKQDQKDNLVLQKALLLVQQNQVTIPVPLQLRSLRSHYVGNTSFQINILQITSPCRTLIPEVGLCMWLPGYYFTV